MQTDWHTRLEQHLRERIDSCKPLQGGCVGEVYAVHLTNGESLAVKVDRRPEPKLDIEAYMLSYLREHSPLPVPAVIFHTSSLLAMEYIPGESRFDPSAQRHAAELIASCHAVREQRYGLERDTLIGGLHQPNSWSNTWVDFFREHRLLAITNKAAEIGRVPRDLYWRIRLLAENLDQYLEEPEHPSLLHGDIWTTNILARKGRISGFIDPAIYYGHPEIELAFISLFNTFGKPFFDAYHALRPIGPGFFEQRRDIYNCYPLLVHVYLFGESYLSGVEKVLANLGI